LSNRKKAAELLMKSRKSFYQSESIEQSLEYANSALANLKKEEITPYFVEWVAFLYGANQKRTPESLREMIPNDIRFLHLKMQFLIQDQKFFEAHKLFNTLTHHSELFKTKKELLYYELLSLFFHAEILFFMKEMDKAFDIISSRLKKINEGSLGEKTKLIVARAYVILGEYYQKRGMTTLAEAMMRKAFLMIENSRLFFVTGELYIRIAEFYVINFPHAKGLNLLERLSQISDYFPHKKMLLKIETQWLFYYVYAGNTEDFWNRLEEIKNTAKLTNDNNALANAYYLEAMFHLYNKDLPLTELHVKKAIELNPNENIMGKCQRLYVVAPFMLETHAEGDRRLKELSWDYRVYGFNKFVDFHTITDKEELETLFIDFFRQDLVWKEEILLSFYKKFTRLFPELFQNTVKRTILDYKSSGLKISLALLNEALGKSYLFLENYEEARIYLSKAQMIYKKTGYLKAAKDISNIIPANEINLLELRNRLEESIYETGNKQKISDFERYKRLSDEQLVRMNVMNEILEFARNIDITDNSVETLKQVLYWISSLSKAKSSFIILADNERIMNHFEINYNEAITDKTLKTIMETPNTIEMSPLKIKRSYIIDDTKRVILCLFGDGEVNYKEDNQFITIFLNQIEPIITLFVKNTLYLQNSMYDSLTGLYSRWYYEERFKEEFEKAIRYKMPISYIIGDIDSFKEVNDNYGHQTGDEVLKEISKIFLAITRKFDIVARYGGEEFSIILPNSNVEGAQKVAEKIRTTIEQMNIFPFNTTMSFGIDSMEKDEYVDYKELERRGDIALYIAKKMGKNRVELYDDHNNELHMNIEQMFH
jgi:diguanylate cyclase (GGDEF)-like protein